jgi:hypothetical protein
MLLMKNDIPFNENSTRKGKIRTGTSSLHRLDGYEREKSFVSIDNFHRGLCIYGQEHAK